MLPPRPKGQGIRKPKTMNGRLHPACGEEVEAVAKHLMWADEIPRWEKTYGAAPDEDFFWKRAETVGTRDGYLKLPRSFWKSHERKSRRVTVIRLAGTRENSSPSIWTTPSPTIRARSARYWPSLASTFLTGCRKRPTMWEKAGSTVGKPSRHTTFASSNWDFTFENGH